MFCKCFILHATTLTVKQGSYISKVLSTAEELVLPSGEYGSAKLLLVQIVRKCHIPSTVPIIVPTCTVPIVYCTYEHQLCTTLYQQA